MFSVIQDVKREPGSVTVQYTMSRGYKTFEPRHEKTNIWHMRKTKTQISFAVTAKLISAFDFATYEGCPSKSWTLVINREFVSEIL